MTGQFLSKGFENTTYENLKKCTELPILTVVHKLAPKSELHAQQAVLFGSVIVLLSAVIVTLTEAISKEKCPLLIICTTREIEGITMDVHFLNLLFLIIGLLGVFQVIWGTFYYVLMCCGFKKTDTDERIRIYSIFGTRTRFWRDPVIGRNALQIEEIPDLPYSKF